MSDKNMYFGKDCPKGKVQIEFVGAHAERHGAYGWKPGDSAFLEVYVDGQRFRIDVGTFEASTPSGKRRGLTICFPMGCEVDKHSVNAVDLYLPDQL